MISKPSKHARPAEVQSVPSGSHGWANSTVAAPAGASQVTAMSASRAQSANQVTSLTTTPGPKLMSRSTLFSKLSPITSTVIEDA